MNTPEPKWEDPIVAEVRRIREEIAARFNYDIDAMFADMQTRQAALGDRLVSPKKRVGSPPVNGEKSPSVAKLASGSTELLDQSALVTGESAYRFEQQFRIVEIWHRME